ncbi:hypothetical protein FAZ69_27235 [Trinickia terrae]|uniref:Uncharacterized protein n=1 Tax=Trinickia terrae TaxID=2571161 RepID=A0A4U1HKD0_9BURK|nr:hypothetical protein [Trinickia terrae]TKC81661.1 hypothetical protein FAZ69_27235 [Trinickia terrae]
MDRRTFVMTSAWVAAAGYLPQRLAVALERPGTLVLADASLAASRAFADAAARRAVPLVEVGDDIGMLWNATLAPYLACTNAVLAGVLRASDAFVLRQLAVSANCRVRHASTLRTAHAPAVVAVVIDHEPQPHQAA